MKPSWDDAPEWAKWLTMDADGEWSWHENEPWYDDDIWRSRGRFQFAGADEVPPPVKEPRP